MIWAFVIVLVLLIPILAIVIDSQVGQALANRISRSVPEGSREMAARVESLEAEVRYLSESLESLREESGFVRALMEGPPPTEEASESADPGRLSGSDA